MIQQILARHSLIQRCVHLSRKFLSTTQVATNAPILSPFEPSAKIVQIVEQIEKLTLLEVVELNQALKEKLKIPDSPMMFAGAVAPASTKSKEDEEVSSQAVQTVFTLKIIKFDETKKVALIKEVKNLVEGLNLVQAKKFVESVPQVVKNNLSKEEAEKLKTTLEALGATCSID